MATTTNFGWKTPDDTDLVKDGAAAIRTALGGVDTSFVDLKGGTTGQVLAKASNTDLDFVWSADAAGIPYSIVDAKGDLIAGTGADTASRLAVGANNTVLTADSTTATGLKWAAPAGAGTWSSVASGSLSGSSLAVTGLSGKKFIIQFKSVSHNGSPGYNNYSLRFNNDSSNNYVVMSGNGNQGKFETDAIGGSRTLNMIWFVDAADSTTTPKIVWPAASGIKNPDGSDPYFAYAGGLYVGTSAITQINFSLDTQTFDNGTYEIWSLS
jgi:hypothetical protein